MGHSKEGRLLSRGILALCTATLASMVWVVPALAQNSTKATVSQTSYYTRTQDPTRAAGGVGLVTGSTPGWPRKDNYLYVARIAVEDDSYAYVNFDLTSLPFGARITSMTFKFRIENEADVGTAGFDPNKPGLKLCLVTSDWVGGEAGAFEKKPESDCGVTTGVTLLGEETRSEPDPSGGPDRQRKLVNYSADLMPMAANWGSDKPNYGISFQPAAAKEEAHTFQVALRTPGAAGGIDPEAMVAEISYESGGEEFSSSFFGDVGSPSFGSISGGDVGYSPPESGAFSTAPSPGPEAKAAGEAGPKTPWWVWSIVPILLGGLALLARIATADVAISRRVGPMTRLLGRRASLGRAG
jgi:hypothetical protein